VFALNPKLSVGWLNSQWNRVFLADNSKSRNHLGIAYLPVEETVKLTAVALLAQKRVPTDEELTARLHKRSLIFRAAGVGLLAVVAFAVHRYVYHL